MASVIDLTAEEDTQPHYNQHYNNAAINPYPRYQPVASTSNATNSNRTIELGDSDDEDDVVFVRREGLQLPPQGHAYGRDANGGGYAQLRQHARTGDDGIFSRDVGSSSNNINVIQEDPLRFTGGSTRATRYGARNGTGRYGGQAPPHDSSRFFQHHHHPRPAPPAQRHYGQPAARAVGGSGGGFRYQEPPDDMDDYLDMAQARVQVPPRPPRGGRQGAGRFTGVFPGNNQEPPQQARQEGGERPGALYQELLMDAIRRENGPYAVAARDAGRGMFANVMGHMPNLAQYFPGFGGFGGMFAGFGGGPGGHNPVPLGEGMSYGPGGTINVKRKVKNYSVRQSHPKFDKRKNKGFERDVVPPPEMEEESEASVRAGMTPPLLPSAKADSNVEHVTSPRKDKGKGKAKAVDQDEHKYLPPSITNNNDVPSLDLDDPSAASSSTSSGSASSSSIFSGQTASTEASSSGSNPKAVLPQLDTAVKTSTAPISSLLPPKKTRKILAPVCASCTTPLFLNQPSKKRPFLLLCGHVVCASCIRSAKERVENWYERKGVEDISVEGWKGADIGEKFEVVDENGTTDGKTGGKRKRDDVKGKGKAKAVGKKAKSKGKKREDEDDQEWIPVPEEDGIPEKDDSSSEDDDRENDSSRPAKKRKQVGGSTTSASTAPRASKRIQNSDIQRVDFRESDEDSDDLMNDGPRQPQNHKGKGKARAVSPSSTASSVPAHLSIPLKHALEVKGKASAGKGKKAQDPNLDENGIAKINKEWLSCPVMGCPGDTDLLSDLGSKKGAWEMFV